MAIVEIASGKVEGFEKRGVQQFRGIPYAAPPIGERRWRPPAAVEPWAGTFEATEYGPIAPQAPSPFHTALGAAIPATDEKGCLTLNVWTPNADGAKRPVMVWLHGGSYVIGDGRTPWYDGVHYARQRDVVVVTCNYRLGALGYLHLDDVLGDDFASSGNCGLLDQVAVLEWVRDNIAGFGGDPGNVTIFGESAGAMSTSTLLGTPAAAGLFHRAITQSGALAHVYPGPEPATEVAHDFLTEMEIEPANARALLDAPIDQLIAAQDALVAKQFGGTGEGIGIIFQPGVDGEVLPRHPLDAVRDGSIAGVPLLAGVTSEEMKLFITFASEFNEMSDEQLATRMSAAVSPGLATVVDDYKRHFDPDAQLTRVDLWSRILTDRVFTWPCVELLTAQASNAPGSVYAYEFAFRSTAMGGTFGAAHAVDIPFTFDNLSAPGAQFFVGEPTSEMQSLATACADAWTSFARTGRPSATGLPEWPAWDPRGAATMILDTAPKLAADPWAFARRAWAQT
ncbi:MAG TPA: carboxylesterase/lipase family protein [Acidimicrobiia bacterium]|nr:carboxylesterase/lipase family protein [Acidimicrobiia bacterium]